MSFRKLGKKSRPSRQENPDTEGSGESLGVPTAIWKGKKKKTPASPCDGDKIVWLSRKERTSGAEALKGGEKYRSFLKGP